MKALAILLLAAAASCTTLTADQEMRITCRAATATVRVLTPMKVRMTPDEIQSVDTAVGILQPSCHDAERGVATTYAILTRAQNALDALAVAESKARARGGN